MINLDKMFGKIIGCFAEHRGIKFVEITSEEVKFRCVKCGRVYSMSPGVWNWFKPMIPLELVPEERVLC